MRLFLGIFLAALARSLDVFTNPMKILTPNSANAWMHREVRVTTGPTNVHAGIIPDVRPVPPIAT